MRNYLLLICMFLLMASLSFAQDSRLTSPSITLEIERLFRIGYVRPAGEADLTRGQMEELREWLQKDTAVQNLLGRIGFSGIGLYETDGGRDMLTRLNAREFDIAFIPSRIWLDQNAGYNIILQTRRERDITSTRKRIVLQSGIIFLSPRSPFFDDEIIDRQELATYLSSQRIAVESSQSLAGFIAPLTKLASEFNLTLPAQDFLWCRSSAEVTKAVLSGLADVGICEEGGFESTLDASGLLDDADSLRRVVVRSSPVPTDPVVVRPALAPAHSLLGRELKRALREFSLEGGLASVSLQNAQDSDYVEVQSLLTEFEEQFGEIER